VCDDSCLNRQLYIECAPDICRTICSAHQCPRSAAHRMKRRDNIIPNTQERTCTTPDHAKSESAKSENTQPATEESEITKSESATSAIIESESVKSESVKSESVKSEVTKPENAKSEIKLAASGSGDNANKVGASPASGAKARLQALVLPKHAHPAHGLPHPRHLPHRKQGLGPSHYDGPERGDFRGRVLWRSDHQRGMRSAQRGKGRGEQF
jgi:hypothetical protein